MAVTSVYNNGGAPYTPAAIGTEYTLFTSSAAGVYVYSVAIPVAFIAGEIVEFRIHSVINGATEVLAYYAVYAGEPGRGAKYSVPVPTATAGDTLRFTLKQTAIATPRAFNVRIMTVG